MFKYILFDLDDTLLDFHASEYVALKISLKKNLNFEINKEIYQEFKKINEKYFNEFANAKFSREEFHKIRFEKLLSYLNLNFDPIKLNETYMLELSLGAVLFPDVIDTLNYLKNKGYKLFIASNGIKDIQISRLKKANIYSYFDYIFVSSEIGVNKPNTKFFDYIFSYLNDYNKVLFIMIGDREESDILGAKNSKIKSVIVGKKDKTEADYKIEKLIDLKNIL